MHTLWKIVTNQMNPDDVLCGASGFSCIRLVFRLVRCQHYPALPARFAKHISFQLIDIIL